MMFKNKSLSFRSGLILSFMILARKTLHTLHTCIILFDDTGYAKTVKRAHIDLILSK